MSHQPPNPYPTPSSPLQFYPVGEADEVDGIEEGLDKWLEGLWPALRTATAPDGAPAGGDAAAAAAASKSSEGKGEGEADLKGVPPLPRCRVRLVWREAGSEAAAVAAAEAAVPAQRAELEHSMPSVAELAYRDPEGHYSAEQPFWAPITDARYLTTPSSDADRQVGVSRD